MAHSDESAKIICPCCQTTLVVDRVSLRVLYHTEHRPKAGGTSFESSLQAMKEREKHKGSRFQQAIDEEKQRKALLGKKFQELRKQAESDPDAPLPARPFDFE